MVLEISVWLSPKVEAIFHFYRMVEWGSPTSSTQSLSLGAPLIPSCTGQIQLTWKCLYLDLFHDLLF